MGTRDDILDAAAEVMSTQGFAKATTKEIARVAGYSEAALYKHFTDKTAIFLAVLSERLPDLGATLQAFIETAGSRTVRTNLARLARKAVDFYTESFPIAVSLFSSQGLLIAHRERLAAVGAGPHHARQRLVEYLRTEQRHGRIRRGADLESAAALLFGACFQRAFEINFSGRRPPDDELDAFAGGLAKTLYESLRPGKP